ncbi:ribosomal protein S18 acetylase RimI-like enzyme [Peribacillus deserti]|uniref:Ribosomal protein S18 acetylase RimI-like enzyme n=1 Tax=Peribacillus deserti TaxID=673318 RepID=A0ABS2QIW1_9BACI|nr:GNAT family N-acetyltransferase [Peribacillus deserti]MBM7692744.1 ribosomal protein S18 acetylase RimI-like enzyme [Peribacillus deserti]
MLIRPAKKQESHHAAILIHAAIKDIAEALTGEKEPSKIVKDLECFYQQEMNRLSYHNCVAAEIDGNLAGILIHYHGSYAEKIDQPISDHLRKKGKSVPIDKEAKDTNFYIDTLSVEPKYQGKGVGTELIRASVLEASSYGYPRISLNVEKENHPAYKLYSRLGFKIEDEILINGHSYDYLVKKNRTGVLKG